MPFICWFRPWCKFAVSLCVMIVKLIFFGFGKKQQFAVISSGFLWWTFCIILWHYRTITHLVQKIIYSRSFLIVIALNTSYHVCMCSSHYCKCTENWSAAMLNQQAIITNAKWFSKKWHHFYSFYNLTMLSLQHGEQTSVEHRKL